MRKNNPVGDDVVLRYAQAFCFVGQLNREKSLAADLHFNNLAHSLAARIRKSSNTHWVLEDSYGCDISITIGKPNSKIIVKLNGLDLCYERQN